MHTSLRRLSMLRRNTAATSGLASMMTATPLVTSSNTAVANSALSNLGCSSSSTGPSSSVLTSSLRFSSSSSSSSSDENITLLREAALKPWQSKLKGDDTIMGVPWVCNERLDFYFSFWSPASWTVQQVVRENFVSIQLSPPKEVMTSVHGISITAFAYHRKVENPYSPELLKSFTRRFISQVDPSGKIIDQVSTTSKLAQDLAEGSSSSGAGAGGSGFVGSSSVMADGGNKENVIDRQLQEIVEKAGGSVCQLSFAPRTAAGTRTAAKGLCRAFYHPNRRFHYVVLAAVPENEYDLVTPLLSHAVCSASELATGSDKGTRL